MVKISRVLFAGTALALLAAPVAASSGGVAVPQAGLAVEVSTSPDSFERGAQNFIDGVAKRGISFLSNKDMSDGQRRGAFRSLLRDSFDLDTIGRFALGRYWRVATPSERAEYQRLFEKMVIDVYAERFGSYDGQKLQVANAKTASETDAIVVTYIVPANGGEKVRVDWRVRKTGARYRVVDVIVEGVSMGVTQRSDFSAVIQRGGGEVTALLKHMRSGSD